MESIVELRRDLHRHPELSGHEVETAARIQRFFEPLRPDRVVTGLGGLGLAFVFSGADAGPTVLLRCELDALPIQEVNAFAHGSIYPAVSHKCGHDGHMAILAAVATELSARRPKKGRAVLLFQPAEETGQGAAAVIQDESFAQIKPDLSFALHNLPGFPMGQVLVRSGVMNAASRGMVIRLSGVTAHAAQPETGVSPASAMGRIIHELSHMPSGLLPTDEIAFVTVVGARLGEKAFGTAPGHAEVWATLRTETDATMATLVDYAEQAVSRVASADRLKHDITYEDVFPATTCDPQAVDLVRRCAEDLGVAVREMESPFRWSEDFGHFTAISEGALFGLGAGQGTPDLHHPSYDFPDQLIPKGAAVFLRILQEVLG